MKKLSIAVLSLLLMSILMSSCASKRCPAYGEAYKYQKDRRH